MSIAEPISPSLTTAPAAPTIGTTDGELLLRFSKHGCQQSFTQLVDAHGPLVWATCRQVLCHHNDVEDAFQATFLILARRAKDIRASDSAAPWLYRVAYRTSLALSRHRRAHPTLPLEDREVLDDRPDPLEHLHQQHMVAVLVEELRALPDRYQAPLVLCYLEGRSRTAVAEVLDCTVATVKGRLARGRQLLRQRLARRGVALSMAATAAAAAVSQAEAALAGSTLPAATASAALTPITPAGEVALSTTVSQLVQQGASAMTYASLVKSVAAVAATLLLGVATAVALDEPAPIGAQATRAAAVGSELTLELDSVPGDGNVPVSEEESSATVELAAIDRSADSARPAPQPSTLDPLFDPSMGIQPLGTQPVPMPPTDPTRVARDPAQLLSVVKQTRVHTQPDTLHRDGEPSLEQLVLMQQHWQLKAEGLRLKADALARQNQEDSSGMKLAEAKLAVADAYEADAERLAVELQIRQRQVPVWVDPAAPQPARAETTYTPAPRYASPPTPASPPPGTLLRLLILGEREDGGALRTEYVLQVDSEGKVQLPWDRDQSIKASDLATLEAEFEEHSAKYLETTSPVKIRQLEVIVRPFAAPQPAPPEERSVLQPRRDRDRSDEIEQMRRQVEQLRRELEAALQPTPVDLPFPQPQPLRVFSEPSPPAIPGEPWPPRAPVAPSADPPRSPDPRPETNTRGEIEQLRRRLEQLEKSLQPQSTGPVDATK